MHRHTAFAALALSLTAIPAQARDACVAGTHGGLPAEDAETVVAIVCEELQAAGASVAPPGTAPPDGPRWEVSARRLGDGLILTLSRLGASGRVERSERLQIADLRDTPVAARRLATAIHTGRPVAETARVDNLVESETRAYEKVHGELFWGVGILGGYIPQSDTGVAYGFTLTAFYEAPRWSVGSDLRFLFAEGDGRRIEDDYDDYYDSTSAFAFAWAVGGRWFLTDTDVSPFLGGGLSLHGLDVDGTSFNGNGFGLGAYASAGLELLRLHGSRLTVDARVDLPFYLADDYTGADGRYVTPVSLGVTYAW